MKNIPKKIYLNLGFDKDEIDIKDIDDFTNLVDVSWSDSRINDQDIEYILGECCDIGKHLLSELRKVFLVNIDFDKGTPKADIDTIMQLWDDVNEYLEIKTIDRS